MSGQLFDKTTSALQSSANLRAIKKNVIDSNIANAETPGYHAKKIDFEDALARAIDLDDKRSMTTSHPDHLSVGSLPISKVRADIYDNPVGAVSNDGNTVDLEKEMASLAENTIMYKAVIQLINKKLASMKYAISETR